VYPYRDRLRWLIMGRYSHLARAVDRRRRVVQDTILERRVESLRAWNTVRFALGLLLAPSVVAALTSAYVSSLPAAPDVINKLVGFSAAVAGFLSLGYLLVNRLLGQLEIDILALLTVEHRQ
jgi:hypothetical protein